MRCPTCGTLQPDTDSVCDVCGSELPHHKPGPKGHDGILASIFTEATGTAGHKSPETAPAPPAPAKTETGRFGAAARDKPKPVPVPRPAQEVLTARAKGLPLLHWPDVKLSPEEESYRDAWKKSSQNVSTPPPIKEKAYKLEGSAFVIPFAPGFILLLAGTAMVFLIAIIPLKILGATVMLAALWLVMQGLDGRATFRCDQKGLWKDAFVSSTRIYWPVVKSASLKESKYPSFLGKIMGNVFIQISTTDNRLHNLAIPVYFGKMTLSRRDFEALKRQLATIVTMMGAQLK